MYSLFGGILVGTFTLLVVLGYIFLYYYEQKQIY
jgi:hypothetical protein